MIKAVIFDVDGVLLDSFEANFKFYNDWLTKIGYPKMSREEYLPLFPRTMWEVLQANTKMPDEKLKPIWEMAAKGEISYPFELLEAPDGMEEAVKDLGKSYFLGIVTGRLKIFINKMPPLYPILPILRMLVGFEDTEKHKPYPEPLLFACKELNVQPNEAVYIGDADTDIECARRAGTKVVVFKYPAVPTPEGADGYFSKFSELESLVRGL